MSSLKKNCPKMFHITINMIYRVPLNFFKTNIFFKYLALVKIIVGFFFIKISNFFLCILS